MKGIIVHDVFNGEMIFINISAINAVAINAVRKEMYGGEDNGSVIYVEGERFIVKESFDEIMLKIREAGSEDKT